MQKIISLALILGISLLFLPGCASTHFTIEQLPCAPPCWQNIWPGKTTHTELLELIQDNDLVESGTLIPSLGTFRIFNDEVRFDLQTGKVSVEVYFYEDRVAEILFYDSLGVTFDEVISELGEPKVILLDPTYGPGGLIPFGDKIHIYVVAIYPEKGVKCVFDDPNLPGNKPFEVKPKLKLDSLGYFDPALYQQLLEAGLFSVSVLDVKETQARMQDWQGFGEYQIVLP